MYIKLKIISYNMGSGELGRIPYNYRILRENFEGNHWHGKQFLFIGVAHNEVSELRFG